MTITEEELREIRSHLRGISREMKAIEDLLIDSFLADQGGKPEEEFIEHVGYSPEQCGRDK